MFDTDTCIRLRSRRALSVTTKFQALRPGDAVMSAVTYGELRLGAEKSSSRGEAIDVLSRMTSAIPVLPIGPESAECYGEIRATLERRGEVIGANDLWIAAHARAAGLTLVTGNEREFRRVPGLTVENWSA